MNACFRMLITAVTAAGFFLGLIDGSLVKSDGSRFEDLHHSLLPFGGRGDDYFVLYDFASYDERFLEVMQAYQYRDRWVTRAIVNTAKAGFFSSDRSIEDYNREIWGL